MKHPSICRGQSDMFLSSAVNELTMHIAPCQDFDKPETRAVEIPCPTCPTWSHFIQDKLKISIYLSLDKYKCIKLIQFCISYFD